MILWGIVTAIVLLRGNGRAAGPVSKGVYLCSIHSNWTHWRLMVGLQGWSLCFPQFCGSLLIKSHWPSETNSLGFLINLCQIPRLGTLTWGSEPHNRGRTSLELFWITHPAGMEFDFIVISTPLLSHWGFFVFGVSFFDEFQHPPVDGCSAAHCNFVALAAGNEHISFYWPSWNRSLLFHFYWLKYLF